MAYVPITVTPSEEISPRARDLARTLETSLQEYRQRNPSLTDAEVRQALVHMTRGHSPAPRVALALALGLGMAVLGLVAFLYIGSGGASGGDLSIPWVAVGIGFLAALAGLAAVLAGRKG